MGTYHLLPLPAFSMALYVPLDLNALDCDLDTEEFLILHCPLALSGMMSAPLSAQGDSGITPSVTWSTSTWKMGGSGLV